METITLCASTITQSLVFTLQKSVLLYIDAFVSSSDEMKRFLVHFPVLLDGVNILNYNRIIPSIIQSNIKM